MMSVGTPLMWMLFAAFVLVALLVDFLAMNKQGAHKVSMGEAAVWSVIWVAVSFVFVGLLWWYLGGMGGDETARGVANVKALEFITGYLVEKALAVDNIFVFLMVFTYFAVPQEYQKRVLMIGILGALVLRALMIFGGAWLIARFDWVLYLFGAFLVFTGNLLRNPILLGLDAPLVGGVGLGSVELRLAVERDLLIQRPLDRIALRDRIVAICAQRGLHAELIVQADQHQHRQRGIAPVGEDPCDHRPQQPGPEAPRQPYQEHQRVHRPSRSARLSQPFRNFAWDGLRRTMAR